MGICSGISTEWLFIHYFHVELELTVEVLVFVAGGKPENLQRKTGWRGENQQPTQPTYGVNSDLNPGHFTLVSNQHFYNTRLASKATFILPLVRTNYGLFNIRFCGPKVWNSIEESLKSLSKFSFKKKLKQQLILAY